MSAAPINTYYSQGTNQIVFPAAILQPPSFGGGYRPAQNFGAVGGVIGHELTHGFDSDESTAESQARATYMKQQYSTFQAVGDSGQQVGNVNGNLTITENIADNGSLGLAFDACQLWLESCVGYPTNDVTDAEADKHIFVADGHSWCNKMCDVYVKLLITTNVHAPNPWRVNGVVMNKGDFAKTFQRKVGSQINPEKKCKT